MDGFLSNTDERETAAVCESLSPAPPFPLPATELPDCLGRLGPLELRLARCASDIRRAQELRHQVFFRDRQSMRALHRCKQRDQDAFDAVCDHLLVIDTDHPSRPVVGTYRLLRQDVADAEFGFYSETEFSVRPLLARHGHLRFLELGRSCVLPAYRDRRTIELLWHGLWRYVRHHHIGAMFGCASFEGTFVQNLALPLSFLAHEASADREWQVQARADRRAAFDMIDQSQIDARMALRSMPPLIKGYLRAGARFSRDAVIDHVFGTTDVFVVMPTGAINQKYIQYFRDDSGRLAA